MTQGSVSVDMPAILEASLATNTVRVSSGTAAGSKLGSMFGPVTVTKA